MESGKRDEAAFPTFPQGHDQEQKDHGTEPKPQRRAVYRPPTSMTTESDPAVSSCRDPAVLVDAGQPGWWLRATGVWLRATGVCPRPPGVA